MFYFENKWNIFLVYQDPHKKQYQWLCTWNIKLAMKSSPNYHWCLPVILLDDHSSTWITWTCRFFSEWSRTQLETMPDHNKYKYIMVLQSPKLNKPVTNHLGEFLFAIFFRMNCDIDMAKCIGGMKFKVFIIVSWTSSPTSNCCLSTSQRSLVWRQTNWRYFLENNLKTLKCF